MLHAKSADKSPDVLVFGVVQRVVTLGRAAKQAARTSFKGVRLMVSVEMLPIEDDPSQLPNFLAWHLAGKDGATIVAGLLRSQAVDVHEGMREVSAWMDEFSNYAGGATADGIRVSLWTDRSLWPEEVSA